MKKEKGVSFLDAVKPCGRFRIRVYKAGKLVEEFEDRNLIVDGARFQMARLVAGEYTGRKITAIKFGTSGSGAVAADAAITDPLTKEIDGFEYPEDGQVQFNWHIAADEGNGKAIHEFGLFCQDGTLFARYVRPAPLNKEPDFAMEGDWTITF
jgi:hypothetical protein